jgi:hypothetical protein
MKMVMFNYGNVLVSVVILCIIMESLALIGDALVMCIYLMSQFPCMHTRIESRKNGDELVMKKSSNISLAIW